MSAFKSLAYWTRYCCINWRNVKGRASRTEFWIAVLVFGFVCLPLLEVVTSILLGSLHADESAKLFAWSIIGWVCFVPIISGGVRRLHDLGVSGWWWVVIFVLMVVMENEKWLTGGNALGGLLFITVFAWRGMKVANKFGEVPMRTTTD